MFILRRLFTLAAVAIVAGLVGGIVGVLVAPARGSETRARLASLVDRHGPVVMESVRKGQDSVTDAVDYVKSRLDSATGSN